VLRVPVTFNSRVQAGDLLAALETETLDADVRNARAGVERATANVRQSLADIDRAKSAVEQATIRSEEAEAQFNRMKSLYDQKLIANQEYLAARSAAAAAKTSEISARSGMVSSESGVVSARAALESSEAALAQAEKNRSNAEIRAPISGVIIDKQVEAGQTVAASFSTPTLFVIAQDLVSMEIHAQVDESDVGLIEVGQQVAFSVAAYPGKKFQGKVRERRLKPQNVQNVVNYTVVVSAENNDDQLLPGMTATLDFQVGDYKDVLLIASAALRFEPPAAARTAARAAQRSVDEPPSGSGTDGGANSATAATIAAHDSMPQDALGADVAELWMLMDDGGLRTVLVRVLASDGVVTAIEPLSRSDTNITEGLKVITRSLTASAGPAIRFGRRG
jgi:HlyD family secretion protein